MCSPMPWAIWTTPINGPPLIQREETMGSPSLLLKRKVVSATANADENAGVASRGLAARKPRKRRRLRVLFIRPPPPVLGPDNPGVPAVTLDEHPIPGAQGAIGGLGDDDRDAVVELDENLLAGPALDAVLDGVAGEAAAERAEHGPGAAVADLVADDAARRGAEDGTGAELVVALELNLLDAGDFAVTNRVLAKVGRAGAGGQHGSEEDEDRLLHDVGLRFDFDVDQVLEDDPLSRDARVGGMSGCVR